MARPLTSAVVLGLLLASCGLSAAADIHGGTDPPGAGPAETGLDPWIADLQDANGQVRLRTATELRGRMEPRYIEPLAALLEDESLQVRYAALRAICEARHPLAIGPLVSFIRRPEGGSCLRSIAARSLGQIADPFAVAALLALLGDRNMDAAGRVAAVRGLGWGVGEGTILEHAAEAALITAEDDPMPEVQAAARDMLRCTAQRRKDLAMARAREVPPAAQPPRASVK